VTREPVLIDLVGCARCGAAEHKQLLFVPFVRPVRMWVEEANTGRMEGELTHWVMCPVLQEPILGTFV
jgi:hypothetical protein